MLDGDDDPELRARIDIDARYTQHDQPRPRQSTEQRRATQCARGTSTRRFGVAHGRRHVDVPDVIVPDLDIAPEPREAARASAACRGSRRGSRTSPRPASSRGSEPSVRRGAGRGVAAGPSRPTASPSDGGCRRRGRHEPDQLDLQRPRRAGGERRTGRRPSAHWSRSVRRPSPVRGGCRNHQPAGASCWGPTMPAAHLPD